MVGLSIRINTSLAIFKASYISLLSYRIFTTIRVEQSTQIKSTHLVYYILYVFAVCRIRTYLGIQSKRVATQPNRSLDSPLYGTSMRSQGIPLATEVRIQGIEYVTFFVLFIISIYLYTRPPPPKPQAHRASRLSSLYQIVTSQDGHDGAGDLGDLADDVAAGAGLGAVFGVEVGVGEAASSPGSAGVGGLGGVAQAGDEEHEDEGGVVLREVGVRALREVEAVGLGVLGGQLLARVRRRVLDPAGLARDGCEDLVVGVDEDGRGRHGEDVAVVLWVSVLFGRLRVENGVAMC